MQKKRLIINIVAPVLGLGVFIGVWYAVAASVGISIILPSPTETFRGFFALLGKEFFYAAIGRTLLRTILGFLIAFTLSLILATLSHTSSFFKKAFAPIAVILRVLPTISVILLVLIWFYSDTAPYVITLLVIFPMLYKTVLDSMERVDPALLEMTKAYRFSFRKRIFSYYLPQMTPSMLTGIGITLSFGVKLTVAAEVLANTQKSMGHFMKQTSAYMETSMLLAWTIAAILLGFLLEGGVLLLKKLILRRKHGKV